MTRKDVMIVVMFLGLSFAANCSFARTVTYDFSTTVPEEGTWGVNSGSVSIADGTLKAGTAENAEIYLNISAMPNTVVTVTYDLKHIGIYGQGWVGVSTSIGNKDTGLYYTENAKMQDGYGSPGTGFHGWADAGNGTDYLTAGDVPGTHLNTDDSWQTLTMRFDPSAGGVFQQNGVTVGTFAAYLLDNGLIGFNQIKLAFYSGGGSFPVPWIVDNIQITYTPVPAPAFSPSGKYVTGSTPITMTSAMTGAAIYYTTDGTTPSAASRRYTDPVMVLGGMTLNAITIAEGIGSSSVTGVTYLPGFTVPAIASINVDGDLSDWSDSSAWSENYLPWIGSMGSTTRAKFAWNDAKNLLYVAIETNESSDLPGGHPVIGFGTGIDQTAIYGNGATQLAFETTAGGNQVSIMNEIHEYKVNIYPKLTGDYVDSGTVGVQAAYSYAGGVWRYEIAIPLWTDWAVGQMVTKTQLSPGDVIYLYSIMQNMLNGDDGTNLSFNGNPGFAFPGGLAYAAKLTLLPHPASLGPLVNDPVVYYSFDNVADLGHDDSGHGYYADVAQYPAGSDPATVITGTANGYFGGAANFPKPLVLNPDNSYVYHNALVVPALDPADVPTDGFTIASWIYLDPDTTENYQLFAAEAEDGNQVVSAQIRLPWSPGQPDTYRVILSADGGTTIKDLYLGPITQGAWVHFAATYDQAANQIVLYINGQVLGGVPATVNLPLAGNWNDGAKIGTTMGWARQFVGQMDEFYLFKRALAPVEILMLAGAEIIPGDADGDNQVDVSDLGILAANYGITTGATWPKGDFNSDGQVDVSDLGILAANYGRSTTASSRFAGTGTPLDFYADAAALGLAVGGDEVAKEAMPVTSTSGCGSEGLQLIGGLFLMGLFLAKLEE